MKIKDLPKVDRPREKLEKYGPERLSDSELLAILLRTGSEGINVVELSSRILRKFSGVGLAKASVKELKNTFGLGSAKGGADFIVGTGERRIVVEVGVNKDDYKQVAQTSAKAKAAYSIIISERAMAVEYNEEVNAVKIPLKYFVLL